MLTIVLLITIEIDTNLEMTCMLPTLNKYFLINNFTAFTLTYFAALNLNLEESSSCVIYVKLLIPHAYTSTHMHAEDLKYFSSYKFKYSSLYLSYYALVESLRGFVEYSPCLYYSHLYYT